MAYIPDGLGKLRRNKKVSQTAREIFEYYCEKADAVFGICFPNLKSVAAEFGIRPDNFKIYDKELQDVGWIVVHPVGDREVRQVFAGWEPSMWRGQGFSVEKAAAEYKKYIFSEVYAPKLRRLAEYLKIPPLEFLNYRDIFLKFRLLFLKFREDFLKFRETYKEDNQSSEPDPLTIPETREEEETASPPPPQFFENFSEEEEKKHRVNADQPLRNEPKIVEDVKGSVLEETLKAADAVGVRPDIPPDKEEEYLAYLQHDTVFACLVVIQTYRNMLDWCRRKGKQASRFRLLNWLKDDLKKMPTTYVPPAEPSGKEPPLVDAYAREDCPRCFGSGYEYRYAMDGTPVPAGLGCRHEKLIEGEWLWQKQQADAALEETASEEFYAAEKAS